MISLFAITRHKRWHEKPIVTKVGPGNQWTKAKETGIPYVVKPETSAKWKISTSNIPWTVERRKKHSERMKLAVAQHPESYTSANRGRTKQIEKYGIKFQGKWELIYFEYCLKNNIKIERCKERFEYVWFGTRTYNPDFYLPESDTYVEIKGYETDRDRAKWRDFPYNLIVIKSVDIKRIMRG